MESRSGISVLCLLAGITVTEEQLRIIVSSISSSISDYLRLRGRLVSSTSEFFLREPPGCVVPTLLHLASEQLEATHHLLCLEVSILRVDDLLLHHVLDNVERLFALVNHVKGLNVFN